jgi:hypothetical protein
MAWPLAIASVAALCAGVALADSFTPVRLSIQVAPVARLHKPLQVTVRVTADPGALDNRSGALRVQVKLADECGGTYPYTSGTTLLDQRLNQQPATGHAYSAAASGSGRPAAYGSGIVCVWLVDEGDGRVWASDQSVQVSVSQACTSAAARYDSDRRHHRHRSLARDRRAARSACGPGVAL